MDVRPVLASSSQVLSAVEVRDGDAAAALGQLASWHGERLRVPRVIVGIAKAPEPAAVLGRLSETGVGGDHLALALPEAAIDGPGMRDALTAMREQAGVHVIVADFGSGSHPEVDFLVDYPGDALCLSPRIADGVHGNTEAAGRVREICSVAHELGWSVIAAEVASADERRALAAVGVSAVAGPGVAPFADAGRLGRTLAGMRVSLPAAPEPSRRAPRGASAPTAQARPAAPVRASAPVAATPASAATPTAEAPAATPARAAEPDRRHQSDGDQELRNRLASRESAVSAKASEGVVRGSPGRSQPLRSAPGEPGSRDRIRVLPILVALFLLALAVYAVLIWQDYVANPLDELIGSAWILLGG